MAPSRESFFDIAQETQSTEALEVKFRYGFYYVSSMLLISSLWIHVYPDSSVPVEASGVRVLDDVGLYPIQKTGKSAQWCVGMSPVPKIFRRHG